jgi:putative sigma-54 modulation protein
MEISVTFKNIEPSDALKEYVEKRLGKLDKLLDKPTEARVVFSTEKTGHIAEISLKSSKLNIQAKERNDNMNAAIDIVVDKIKSQLNKFKKKIQSHKPRSSSKEDISYEEIP